MATKKIKPAAASVDAGIVKKVGEYFKSNPTVQAVYSTTDGFLFEIKKFAFDHARTLGDDEPELHPNPTLVVDELEEEDNTDQ